MTSLEGPIANWRQEWHSIDNGIHIDVHFEGMIGDGPPCTHAPSGLGSRGGSDPAILHDLRADLSSLPRYI